MPTRRQDNAAELLASTAALLGHRATVARAFLRMASVARKPMLTAAASGNRASVNFPAEARWHRSHVSELASTQSGLTERRTPQVIRCTGAHGIVALDVALWSSLWAFVKRVFTQLSHVLEEVAAGLSTHATSSCSQLVGAFVHFAAQAHSARLVDMRSLRWNF
eukprot:TRINITY_DN6446_c0_g1_i3.p1 TRINITY_DN6446_c0_g1~~TRINITY_DN6446_c0_g1_i3.p1  ORF type:complete len:164 (-),score=7.00 TRINITY_DN6446_c0_g1_i3:95-586(-)